MENSRKQHRTRVLENLGDVFQKPHFFNPQQAVDNRFSLWISSKLNGDKLVYDSLAEKKTKGWLAGYVKNCLFILVPLTAVFLKTESLVVQAFYNPRMCISQLNPYYRLLSQCE